MRVVLQAVALAAILAVACELIPPAPPPDVVVTAGFYHLGDDEVTDWPEVAARPDGTRLDLTFPARATESECTLVLTQRDVDAVWTVRLNGHEVTRLKQVKESKTLCYQVPPGLLVDGDNRFEVVPVQVGDDIVIGNVQLMMRPMREVLHLGRVEVTVMDAAGGKPMPARLSITDTEGRPAPIYFAEVAHTAIRDGIAYTALGTIDLELPAGVYHIAATRGMEWSLARTEVPVHAGGTTLVALALRREVDTTGYVACDTHIHTLTHSGHGDASVEERLVTLAGEGVELAIATDHNHNIDYRPLQRQMSLGEHFTPVVGNEVTTDNGHFNAFPLDPRDEVPPHELSDWTRLVDGMRAKGAAVVILNHPRWPDEGHPLERFGFDPISGDRTGGPEQFTFDAMELVNSDSLLDDPRQLLRDWFALLDRGRRITAVGSSDSHAVGVIVGQGRTYVRSSTDQADRIDVEEAARSFLGARASVSLGIFADVTVNDRGMGDLVPVPDVAPGSAPPPVHLSLRVATPAWVRPERAEVYRNGRLVAERELELRDGQPTDQTLDFLVPMAANHDAYLVCVVTGPGIRDPWWPTARDYTFAATNPVFLDQDGDGRWTSPRETASRWLQEQGPGTGEDDAARVARLLKLLETGPDPAVVIQLLSLLRDEPAATQVVGRVALDLYPEDEGIRRYLRGPDATERPPR